MLCVSISAPDDSGSGRSGIVNVDPDDVRDTNATNIVMSVGNVVVSSSYSFIMTQVTPHVLSLFVIMNIVCFTTTSPIPQNISLVRFPSLKTLVTSVTGLFDNIHRRSFNFFSKVKIKPSYKQKHSFKSHSVVPGIISNVFISFHIYLNLNYSVKNIPNEVFHPITAPHHLTFKAPLPPASATPTDPVQPSYTQFWSYFPLGRVTPVNIESGIWKASQDVDHDGFQYLISCNFLFSALLGVGAVSKFSFFRQHPKNSFII